MNYKKIVFSFILLIGLVTTSVFWYIKTHSLLGEEKKVDYYTLVQSDSLFVQGESLRAEGKYDEAINAYRKGLDSKVSSGEKSVFDVAIGTTQSIVDPKGGIQHLVDVGNNTSYPNISRAYALQYAYQMFKGYQDPQLLRPFFSASEFTKIDFSKPLSDDIIKSLHEKIYTLAPLPLTKVRLAYLAWNMNNKHDIETVNKYMGNFDLVVKDTENYQGMVSLLPVTYLIAANLSVSMKSAGVTANFGTPEYLYEQAITKAQIAHIESTYQFTVLDYANYLSANGQLDKAIELLKNLAAHTIDPMIKATVVLPDSSVKYSALVNSSQTNSSLKSILIQIGFILK